MLSSEELASRSFEGCWKDVSSYSKGQDIRGFGWSDIMHPMLLPRGSVDLQLGVGCKYAQTEAGYLCNNDPGEMAASWASVRTEEVRRGG